MTGSKLRASERRQLRKEVADIVEPLPIPYVLETVARRLELRDGWLEVRLRDGFVQHATRARVLAVGDLDPPPGWSEERTQALKKSVIRMARAFDRSVELKFDGEEIRSLVTIHEYTAAELAKDRPTPSPSQRTRKRRVEL